MTTQRHRLHENRLSRRAAASGLALIAFPLVAGGCGAIFETPQAACRRMMNHIVNCSSDSVDVPDGFDELLSLYCASASESDGDWSTAADCVTKLSCAQLTGDDPTAQLELLTCLAEMGGGFPGFSQPFVSLKEQPKE